MTPLEQAEKTKCELPHKIQMDFATGKMTLPENILDDGGCSSGCCDYFKCKECGYQFRIEWPD